MGFFDVAEVMISGVWDFFTELEFPGLAGVTFASLAVAVAMAGLGLRLVSFLLGLSGGGGGESTRTSSTNNPKISEERQSDEF